MAVISDLRQGNQLIWEAITTGLRVEPNLKMERKLNKKFLLSIAIFFVKLRIGQVKRKKAGKKSAAITQPQQQFCNVPDCGVWEIQWSHKTDNLHDLQRNPKRPEALNLE